MNREMILRVGSWPFSSIRKLYLTQVQGPFSNDCPGACEQVFTEFTCFLHLVWRIGFNMRINEFIYLCGSRYQLFPERTKSSPKYRFIFRTICWLDYKEVPKLKWEKHCKIVWTSSWNWNHHEFPGQIFRWGLMAVRPRESFHRIRWLSYWVYRGKDVWVSLLRRRKGVGRCFWLYLLLSWLHGKIFSVLFSFRLGSSGEFTRSNFHSAWVENKVWRKDSAWSVTNHLHLFIIWAWSDCVFLWHFIPKGSNGSRYESKFQLLNV